MTSTAEAPAGERAFARAPYLGLAAFGDSHEDAELFFGRAGERDLVVANLQSARVTVLYGPSGVGKSSLLHAGVAHRLRTMEQPSQVIVLDDWSSDPTATLTAGIRAAVIDPSDVAGADLPLSVALDRLREQRSRALIVILDRFEDYLRLHPQPSVGGFDDALAELFATPEVLVRMLIAVRDDRLADLDRLDGVIPGLFDNVLRLERLTREAAREAILGPLQRHNAHLQAAGAEAGREVTLEDGLAGRVLDELGELSTSPSGWSTTSGTSGDRDLGRAPIEPAFLSLTMRRLWDADIAAGGGTLRLATLATLGGAARIFATHLDETMATLSPSERRLAAEILRFLVTPSGAIQRYSAQDLAAYVGRGRPAVESLTEKLTRAPGRLLHPVVASAAGETRVDYELTHQVLARPALEWRSRYETARLQGRSRRLLLALVAMTAVALALVGYIVNPGPLNRLELSSVDARFAVRGAQRPDRDIVLVPVDQAALNHIDSPGPSRAAFARALEQIATAGARVIACDVVFEGPQTPQGDAMLIAAVHRIGKRLVLAAATLDLNGETELFGNPGQVFSDQSAPAAGYFGFPGNPDDPQAVSRTMERSVSLPGGTPMDTLAVVTAGRAGVKESKLNALPATTWIDFRGGAGTFPAVPLADVLAAQPAALAMLRHKIVVLGITAPSKGDNAHHTDAPGRSVMSGMEVQANAISTALRGFPLRSPGLGVNVFLIVLLGLTPLALAFSLGMSAGRCAAGVLVIGALFCVGAQVAFDSGHVVNIVFPLVALALSAAGVLTVLIARRGGEASGRPGVSPGPARVA